MRDIKNWAWLLLFGSIWGLSEVAGGGIMYAIKVPYASIFLAAWALFILAVARGFVNKPGSSTVIGAVATLFKLVNASPFICHLLGIFMLGLAFDIAASILGRSERRFTFRNMLTGVFSAYGGYAFFALSITYLIRYDSWVLGGWPKVANHMFVSGSIAALVAAVLVPIGYFLGAGSLSLQAKSPRWLYAGTAAGVALLWVLGRIAG
ncbi:MAG: hypothetical protein ACERK6_00640 [Candidatus Aminicenantaceae bacterium]